jgi:hypothetical protein
VAGLGGFLVVLGVGSLLLPMFNMQFRILEPIDPYQPWAGLIIAVIGIVLLAMPRLRARSGGGGDTGPTA